MPLELPARSIASGFVSPSVKFPSKCARSCSLRTSRSRRTGEPVEPDGVSFLGCRVFDSELPVELPVQSTSALISVATCELRREGINDEPNELSVIHAARSGGLALSSSGIGEGRRPAAFGGAGEIGACLAEWLVDKAPRTKPVLRVAPLPSGGVPPVLHPAPIQARLRSRTGQATMRPSASSGAQVRRSVCSSLNSS
jgi:hypothetical protein